MILNSKEIIDKILSFIEYTCNKLFSPNNMIIHNSTNLTDNSINYLKYRGIYGAVRLIDKNIIDTRKIPI